MKKKASNSRRHAKNNARNDDCQRGTKQALVYLAAWDVRRAKVFGRCEPKSGIVPFDALVAEVMTKARYATARRVF